MHVIKLIYGGQILVGEVDTVDKADTARLTRRTHMSSAVSDLLRGTILVRRNPNRSCTACSPPQGSCSHIILQAPFPR